jgi:hypothetical protein
VNLTGYCSSVTKSAAAEMRSLFRCICAIERKLSGDETLEISFLVNILTTSFRTC